MDLNRKLAKNSIAHVCSLCILFRIKYNKSISILEMLQFLEDVMNFDEMQIYLLNCELENIKLNLNDKLIKLFEFKSDDQILNMYETLQNFDEDNISTLKRNL